ncbi:MAG TPA: hypothetical protein VFW24_00430 [Acidimicrobiales bacterium]|nr:hypothetical protein [Acidimicrobiales bacterium]
MSSERHSVVVERRGTAHRACCTCGWSGHSWNELRPAEADAWHHVHGDERIVDVRPGPAPPTTSGWSCTPPGGCSTPPSAGPTPTTPDWGRRSGVGGRPTIGRFVASGPI